MACTLQNICQVSSCSLSGTVRPADRRFHQTVGLNIVSKSFLRKHAAKNVIVRCEAPTKGAPPATAKVSKSEGPGTFTETMAFSGPAPEIINGRLAMWGFAASAIVELTEGKTIGEQFLGSPFGNIFFVIMIVLATFIPTFVADVSLKELLKTASESGMPPQLKYANAPIERWTGRVAMLAFAIFLVIEGVTGSATFTLLKSLAGSA